MRPTFFGATLSNDRFYRYTLERAWPEGQGTALWIMLNPSKADEWEDDPTIRRVVNFSASWGYQRAVVCNLFAFRSTDPTSLQTMDLEGSDVVGPQNEESILFEAAGADVIVCAWGNSHQGLLNQADATRDMLRQRFSSKVRHLGLTKQGHPRHPVRLASSTPLESWAA